MRPIWALSLLSSSLIANPENLKVVSGEAIIHSPALHILEVTTQDKTVLHWDSFSIAKEETARFNLPDVHSTVLNRVTGGNLSRIAGLLESNGRVFLINPNGVVITEDGMVQTASFLASTLDINTEDFLKDGPLVFQGDSKALITNHGTINAWDGDVTLLAYQVINVGSLEAKTGTVGLGAAQSVILQPCGDEKISIQIDPSETKEGIGIHQMGRIEAIRAELKANGNPYTYAIKNEGIIDAQRLENSEGRVVLLAEEGHIEHSGNIEAKTVHILGQSVALNDQATICASGKNDGGSVLIGGDFQGKNPKILNSKWTFVGKEVSISADALEEGDGGKIVVWSDINTFFYGALSTHAGSRSGNGGFMEVSGAAYLDFDGRASAEAPYGKTGELLLDPSDVTLSTAAVAGGALSACPVSIFTPVAALANANIAAIIANLTGGGGCSVTVTSTSAAAGLGDITLVNPFAWVGAVPAARTFAITAHRHIFINSTLTIATAAGGASNLTLTAGTGTPGGIFINSPIVNGPSTGAITMSASGGITLNANVTVSNATTTTLTTTGGDINVIGRLTNTLGGPISLTSVASVFVGNGTQTLPSQIGSATGAVTINLTGAAGDLGVSGGSALGAFAQIGFDTGAVIGGAGININITDVPGNLIVRGGTGNLCYAVIGHGNATGVNTGTRTANINMPTGIGTTIGGNVLLQGGTSGTNSFAQIGHVRGSAAPGVTVTGDIDMRFITGTFSSIGGASTGSFAMIGHGGRQTAAPDTYTGSIRVNSTGTMSLTGGSAAQTFASIGDTAFLLGAGTLTMTTAVFSATCGTGISLQANPFSEAILGSRAGVLGGGTATISVPSLTVSTSAAGNLTMLGAIPSTAANNVLIGAMSTTGTGSTVAVGTASSVTSVTVAGNLLIQSGGPGANSSTFAYITNCTGAPVGGPFTTTVTVTGNSLIQGGNNQAAIINTPGTVGASMLSFLTTGNLSMISQPLPGSLGTADIINNGTGTTTVSATNISMTGFPGGPACSIRNTLNTTLTVTATTDLTLDPNSFINLAMGGAATLTANATGGNLMLRNGSFIRNLGTGTVTANAPLGSATIQGGAVGPSFISGNSIPMTTYGGSLNMIGFFPASPASIIAATGAMLLIVTDDIDLNENSFITLSGGAGALTVMATLGDVLVFNSSAITNSGTGTTTVTAGGIIDILGGANGLATITGGVGAMTITAGTDINLTSTIGGSGTIDNAASISLTIGGNMALDGLAAGQQSLIHTTAGNISAIAQNNISLRDNAAIRNDGVGNITLVVDQQAPLPPFVGPGLFFLDPGASMTTVGGGLLRIFTATPSQDFVFGTLNGATIMVGGPSSATEQYSTYFSLFLGGFGTPFTIFYKTASVTPVPTPTPSGGAVITVPNGFFYPIAFLSAEMLNNLKRFDESWWLEPFTVSYQRTKQKNPCSSYDFLKCVYHPVIVRKINIYPLETNIE